MEKLVRRSILQSSKKRTNKKGRDFPDLPTIPTQMDVKSETV
ncbi:hypothetical protein [Sunxiuqinia sp. sy24]